jgi:hypothetical protein
MAVENFSTYTEVDSASDITVTATKIDVSSMRRDADSGVYNTIGAGHFGDFEHLITLYITATPDYGAYAGFWAVTNGQYTAQDMTDATTGMLCYLFENGGDAEELYITDNTNTNNDVMTINPGASYYLTIARSGTTLTCEVYSDSGRTSLIDTLSITCGTGTYSTIASGFSRDSSSFVPDAVATWYVENLDLQEAAAGWSHKIMGLDNANIAKVYGIDKANIAYINGV